jgi:GNAT superfamily N-acetyltransferase
MRRAGPEDISLLVQLMDDFYAEGGYRLDRARATDAFAAVISDERLGYVWIIQAGQVSAGHVVVTVKYAMEYGGLIACLDDLYVGPQWRNRGLATASLQEVREFCRAAGIRALTVEVGFDNGPAQKVYRRIGFEEASGRQLLAFALAAPAHLS